MIYEYMCQNKSCNSDGVYEISKSVNDLDRLELCESCNTPMARLFSVANVNVSSVTGQQNYQQRQKMGIGKRDETTPIVEGDKTTEYLYKCFNEKCDGFDKHVEIIKSMAESEREEFCEHCKEKMGRVYSFSFRWGKGSRPDSDSWSEKLEQACENNDREMHLYLMNHYDSTGKSYFADDEEKKKKYKVVGKDFNRYFEYKCDNEECNSFGRVVYVEKLLSESGREEVCEVCGNNMLRDFGLGGFNFKEKGGVE